MYLFFGAENIPGVLAFFDKNIFFSRPGTPFIPFSGTFTGINEVVKMFQIQNQTLKMKSFVPDKICTNEDSVVVIGHDEAEVIETGKSYAADWVQAYTFKEGKIVHAQVFMDTKLIADAFSK
jgi:ketosteroid isomerase-like protein